MGALTILVTGAAGHVGAATLAAARARGHRVRGLVRRGPAGPDIVACDLNAPDLVRHLQGVDAVIHCAAALTGSEDTMRRDTVAATQSLMQAVTAAGVPRVVLVGSMSVYGTAGLAPGDTVDEDTAREDRPDLRDAYCRAKIAQEDTAIAGLPSGAGLLILRAGAVWGPGHLWNGHLGIRIGPALVRIGRDGQIPLIHRDHCAEALVLAAETACEGVEDINLVDDDLPDRRRYIAALRRTGWPRVVVPLPWPLADALAGLGLPGPGLLRRPVLRARMMPLRYANARLHERLGWQPRIGFDAAMAAAAGNRP